MHKYLLLFFSFFFLSCFNNTKYNKADEQKETSENIVIDLPKKLQEISGITFITDSLVAAIEDEHGIIYYYDLGKQEIIKEYTFADDGDYEDIVKVGSDLYVVKSDGTIYEIRNFANKNPAVIHYNTPLKGKNDIEGLTYNKELNSLLLSVKEKNLDKNQKDTKNIYQFSLIDKTLNEIPVYQIHFKDIESAFESDALIEASKKFLKAAGNDNLNEVIKPSALTYHPIDGNLYILSAINNMVIVLDKEGAFLNIIKLTGKEFTQPEGLAFNSKGEMFISNEGKNKKGNITKVYQTDAK
ncbi:SdiA-regulated domain-containing protein [Pedobacter alpinus]|uniref:SdiA-regulated domain-containing protein n=1 Tax=Pedobacter alpinus TaxID=1590643 RepID=A0ABW5TS38_9SPHI